MKRALCTYCSAPKREDHGLLPAVERYLSKRIRMLALRAAWSRDEFFILSGEYGLLGPDDPIPWYDHLLIASEVEALVPAVERRLRERGIALLEYHTAPLADVPQVRPYFDLISGACKRAGVELEIVMLPGDLP